VVPTTNHLEAFNGVLKRKHLRRWQNRGRKLRLDILLHILIFHALPSIFRQREIEDQEMLRRNALIIKLPGGKEIIHSHKNLSVSLPPVAYWTPDDGRDQAAALLIQNRQISVPSYDEAKGAFAFSCYSSLAVEHDSMAQEYTIDFYPNGTAACTCQDICRQGGACKHMRAALCRTQILLMSGVQAPTLRLPSTEEEARLIQARLPDQGLAPETPPTLDGLASAPAINPLGQSISIVNDLLTMDEAFLSARNLEDREEDSELPNELQVGEYSDYSGYSTPMTLADDITDVESVGATDVLELPGLESISKQAVNDQTIARTLHDLEKITPRLSQISEWLKDVHSRTPGPDSDPEVTRDVERASSVRAVFHTVTQHLDRILEEVNGQSELLPPSRLQTPPPSSGYRSRAMYDILGASPEPLTQKRRQSWFEH
jgi:hypothetical protein